jgi:hypothetical protein
MQSVTQSTSNHSIVSYAFHFETLYNGQAATRDYLLDMYKDSLPTENLKKERKMSSLIIGQIGDPGLNGRKV